MFSHNGSFKTDTFSSFITSILPKASATKRSLPLPMGKRPNTSKNGKRPAKCMLTLIVCFRFLERCLPQIRAISGKSTTCEEKNDKAERRSPCIYIFRSIFVIWKRKSDDGFEPDFDSTFPFSLGILFGKRRLNFTAG